MKKKAGRASRADMNSVIALATSQAKSRVQQLDADGIASVSGGGSDDSGGIDIGDILGGGPDTTAGMVDTGPEIEIGQFSL